MSHYVTDQIHRFQRSLMCSPKYTLCIQISIIPRHTPDSAPAPVPITAYTQHHQQQPARSAPTVYIAEDALPKLELAAPPYGFDEPPELPPDEGDADGAALAPEPPDAAFATMTPPWTVDGAWPLPPLLAAAWYAFRVLPVDLRC